MRILTIVNDLGPGGTQRAAQNGAMLYQDAGHDAAALAIEKGGPRAEALQNAGIEVWVGGPDASRIEPALAEAIRWQPDLVHIHRTGHTDPRSGRILRAIKDAASRRVPVIETNHFSRVDRSPDRLLIDVHVQLSRWCLWKWQQWARGLTPAPVGVVIPHMVDVRAFARASDDRRAAFRAAHGVPEDAVLFGRVGQPIAWGWSPIIFGAFERVARRHDAAWLLLVGLPESFHRHVDALPEPVRRRVVRVPFLHGDEALRDCYAALDCFLHAKLVGESFGLVLVEAMLGRCPIISLSTPLRDNSQLEVVGHERGGLLVTDESSMVDAMERLIGDEAERARLASSGAEWVQRTYATEVIGPRMLGLVDLVAASRSPADCRAALEEDAKYTTSVQWSELRALMHRVMGRVSWRDRALVHVIHVPWVHRVLVRGKRMLGRGRTD